MKKKRFFTVGACMLGTLFALLFIFRDPPNPDPIAALPETKADDRQFMRAETAPDAMPVADETEPSPEPEMEPEPIHYTEDGMDPEDQPRDFYVQHFKPGDLPEGFVLNNVRLTDRGFELEPPKPGEEGQPRIGMVQSPPLKFTFESNGFAPMWKENLP